MSIKFKPSGPDQDFSNKPELSPRQKQRKHRLESTAVILVTVGLAVLTLVQREVINLGPGLSDSQGLVALVSINLSVLLITLLIILILRHLYRIFFERQGYGSLQTKMVVAFICLSLLPTLLIFHYSYRQLIRGHDLWFSLQIEEALKGSIDLTEATLNLDNHVLGSYVADILEEYQKISPPPRREKLRAFLEEYRSRFHLSTVEYYDGEGRLAAQAGGESWPAIYHEWFFRQLSSAPPWNITVETEAGDLTRLVWPIFPPSIQPDSGPKGFLVVGRLTLAPIRSQMEDVRQSLTEYQNALMVQRPFRFTQLTALTVMAALTVFISVWIGSHLADSLTRPVLDLVKGTQRVAAGDWDFTLTPHGRSGEFVELVSSFNAMTKDLKNLYVELDNRRRFLETILKNVSTGVVILDNSGRPRHLNQAAAAILSDENNQEIQGGEITFNPNDFEKQKDFTLPPPLAALVAEVVLSPPTGRRSVERNLRLNLGSLVVSLKASLTALRNEEGEPGMGYLLAFDDLTELEKAQRVAAWQEVARRIAHEVKNPLTPIQLSAQRLYRRFFHRLSGEQDAAIFTECTEVITRQVEEMKKLVDEFSRFARLPEINPQPGDFAEFITDSLALFRQAHKRVDFQLSINQAPPIFAFDPEQMRRVLTNLLDNAVTAMGEDGQVNITLETNDLVGLRLTIADTGPGLEPQIIDRLFEPHVSTKEGGQGLGLAIVRTIISDHGGFIKAQNRTGGGAKFIIELPLRS